MGPSGRAKSAPSYQASVEASFGIFVVLMELSSDPVTPAFANAQALQSALFSERTDLYCQS